MVVNDMVTYSASCSLSSDAGRTATSPPLGRSDSGATTKGKVQPGEVGGESRPLNCFHQPRRTRKGITFRGFPRKDRHGFGGSCSRSCYRILIGACFLTSAGHNYLSPGFFFVRLAKSCRSFF